VIREGEGVKKARIFLKKAKMRAGRGGNPFRGGGLLSSCPEEGKTCHGTRRLEISGKKTNESASVCCLLEKQGR